VALDAKTEGPTEHFPHPFNCSWNEVNGN